jgi:hypothetical protein
MQSIMDCVGILTNFSIAAPQRNKNKIDRKTGTNRMEYYAVVAFPPEAGPVLHALVSECATQNFGGLHPDVQHTVRRNDAPNRNGVVNMIPGVPADWLMVRAASEYAPYVADEAGAQLSGDAMRAVFYPGKRVRVSISCYKWIRDTGRGVNFNLDGIMAASDGERLNIGSGQTANAFSRYANPNAGPASTAQTSPGGFGQGVGYGGMTGQPQPQGFAAPAPTAGFGQPQPTVHGPAAGSGGHPGPQSSPFGGQPAPQLAQHGGAATQAFAQAGGFGGAPQPGAFGQQAPQPGPQNPFAPQA